MNTCLSSCPQGSFGRGEVNSCDLCQNGCVSCASSSSHCQSCKVFLGIGYYFYNNMCLTFCPDGTVKNDGLNIC